MCGCVLESHGTDAASVDRRPMFGRTGVVFELYLLPQADEVVQSPQVAVLVVSLHPRRAVVHGHPVTQRDCLAKVNEVDAAQISAIVHKQEGASNYLETQEDT